MDINSISDISVVNFVTAVQVIMCLSLVWLLQTITSQLYFALWEHMRNWSNYIRTWLLEVLCCFSG